MFMRGIIPFADPDGFLMRFEKRLLPSGIRPEPQKLLTPAGGKRKDGPGGSGRGGRPGKTI
jgi:hypothetical protein